MATKGDRPPGISSGRRWTIGRVATDLAIIMVAVSFALDSIVPQPKGGCGMTTEFYISSLGLAILGVRTTWPVLKLLNDAGERRLADLSESRCPKKSQPLDDF